MVNAPGGESFTSIAGFALALKLAAVGMFEMQFHISAEVKLALIISAIASMLGQRVQSSY